MRSARSGRCRSTHACAACCHSELRGQRRVVTLPPPRERYVRSIYIRCESTLESSSIRAGSLPRSTLRGDSQARARRCDAWCSTSQGPLGRRGVRRSSSVREGLQLNINRASRGWSALRAHRGRPTRHHSSPAPVGRSSIARARGRTMPVKMHARSTGQICFSSGSTRLRYNTRSLAHVNHGRSNSMVQKQRLAPLTHCFRCRGLRLSSRVIRGPSTPVAPRCAHWHLLTTIVDLLGTKAKLLLCQADSTGAGIRAAFVEHGSAQCCLRGQPCRVRRARRTAAFVGCMLADSEVREGFARECRRAPAERSACMSE